MVIWGAIWGAILGWLWPGRGFLSELTVIAGALLGVAAGLTLRKAVRREIAAGRAQGKSAPAAGSAAADDWTSAPPKASPVESDAGAATTATAKAASSDAQEPAAAPPSTTPSIPAAAIPSRPERNPSAVLPTQYTPWPDPPAPPSGPAPVTLAFEKFKSWLFGGNTVVRMGLLVLFVGLAFLAKYAAEHALLPPELRLAAIACAGIALFIFGFRLRHKEGRLAYALALQGAGVAVLYLTVFAAFRL